MSKLLDSKKPGFVHDGPERERKYRVMLPHGANKLQQRVRLLKQIFAFVMNDNEHFRTLGQNVHTGHFDPRLAKLAETPHHIKPLRERFYWATSQLDGYKPKDHRRKIECRTEHESGKSTFKQVLKLGIPSGRTLLRQELDAVRLNSFGVNFDSYKPDIQREVKKLIGDNPLKPMIRFQAQTKPLLYCPNMTEGVLFEIKSDFGIMRTFDGTEFDIVEIEIEEKNRPKGMGDGNIEKLFAISEARLFRAQIGRYHGSDILTPITESKPEPAFRHLLGQYLENSKAFEKAIKKLSPYRWTELAL